MAGAQSYDVEEFRQVLLEERARLREQLGDAAGDGLGRNPDRSDLALAYSRREQRTALTAMQQERLQDVQAALERIDAGTYGRCELCGERIDPARLRVLPSATRCIKCQRSQA